MEHFAGKKGELSEASPAHPAPASLGLKLPRVPGSLGLARERDLFPRVDQCPFDTVVVWRAVPWRPPVGPCVLVFSIYIGASLN